jgi:hypothetical protein
MAENPYSSHSCDVLMWLEGVAGYERIELSRVTPTSVVLKQRVDAPPCQADLVVSIDGKISRSRVDISSGFSSSRLTVSAFSIDHVAPF